MRTVVLTLAFLAFAAPASAQLSVLSDAPFQPEATERLVVHSTIVGHDFEIVVTAPPARPIVSSNYASQKFPAIYALDGGYRIAGPVAQMMAREDAMAPAYVVAIDYAGPSYRNTDLLYRDTPEVKADIGGGGAKFEAFLTQELRPWLEARYPLDSKRAILFGQSFGGIFATNVLVSDPGPWDAFIIASPSTPRDPDLMLDLRETARNAAGKRAFVAVGGREIPQMLAGAARVATALKAAGLTVESRTFEGQGHIDYYPALIPAAFAWVLPPRPPAN